MRKTTQSASSGSLPKIDAPATRDLNAAGYENLSQLAGVDSSKLLKLHGMGPKAIGILREALATQGLAFGGEELG